MSDHSLLQEIRQCDADLTHFQKNLSLQAIEQWPRLMARLQNLLYKMPEAPANQNLKDAFHAVYLKLERTISEVELFKQNLAEAKKPPTAHIKAAVIYNKFKPMK